MSLEVVLADVPGVARDRVVAVLRDSPGMNVTATADLEGLDALLERVEPDVVVVAIDMPSARTAVRRVLAWRRVPIVALAQGDAEAAEALAAGAVGVAARPDDGEHARRQFVDMVRSLSTLRMMTGREPRPGPPSAARPVAVVAIVASTGGPPALVEVLHQLPDTPTTPVLIVQHIAEGFAQGLVEWLRGSVRQQVRVAVTGERPRSGDVLLAPDGAHLTWRDGTVQLSHDPPVHGHRPSASVLLHSLAPEGAGAVAVVLTGMGSDGADGAAALRQAGGHVLCQDAETAVINGMPAAAIAAGGATEVLPLERIGPRLAQLLAPS